MDVGGLGLGDRLINIEYGIANLPHSRLILVHLAKMGGGRGMPEMTRFRLIL